MGFKVATQQRSANRISRSIARPAHSTRVRPNGYHLQRTIGNSATSRLFSAGYIQPKLTISDPGDASEREADRVAGEVMRMAEPQSGLTVQSSPLSIQRKCTKCEDKLKPQPLPDEEEKIVQAKLADTSAEPEVSSEVESYLNTSQGAGQALPTSSRTYFEPRFGRDFSNVRVHTNEQASRAARTIAARAFTSGENIVFGAGQYAPQTHEGRTLLAHELTHVVQQSALDGNGVDKTNAGRGLLHIASEKESDKVANVSTGTEKLDHGSRQRLSVPQFVRFGTLQRTPAAPVRGDKNVPFDRSKVDVAVIPDVLLDTELHRFQGMATRASISFRDPAIKGYSSTLYDPADGELTPSASNPIPSTRKVDFALFDNLINALTQGRHILRCIGYDGAGQPVAYADRSFYVWTSTPTGKPPDIAALEAEKTALEAITKVGSGKSFNEVAIAFTKLQDVKQRLGILTTGTGPFVGSHCPVKPAGAKDLGCTNVVTIVLENVFKQQGRGADWAKLEKKINKNILSHSKKLTDIEGEDIQAALQSELGWKGVFWAPDPRYEIPKDELSGARSDEAGYASIIAKGKRIYRPEKKKPTISIDYSVTDYAPEAPKSGYGEASKTKKDTTQLDKLKKLPFGVLSAHGAHHMAFFIYGKVVEVHWETEATDVDLIEQTDLEKWAIGPESGYHYFASGAIVAPAADIDAALK